MGKGRRSAGFVAVAGSLLMVGTLVAPAAQASVTTPVSVATFNVCKGGPDGTSAACAAPAPSWTIRRDRVANTISAASPDVLALQEITNNPTPNGAPTMKADVEDLLAGIGYQVTDSSAADQCVRPRDAKGKLAGPNPCTNTTELAFNAATTHQVVTTPNGTPTAGNALTSTVVAQGLPGATVGPESASRNIAWSFLNARGHDVLAVSVHTTNAKTAAAEADRVTIGQAIGPWTGRLLSEAGYPADTPVIIAGDLNSFDNRNPEGIQQVLRDSGWIDAASAPDRIGARFYTVSHAKNLDDGNGFPAKPLMGRKTKNNPDGEGTRIDYIFTSPGTEVESYEVFVRTTPDGHVDPAFQASDHNMVLATVDLG